jgi:hypothetical protein
MPLNTDPNFPPSGNAPYAINREWCMGDSLGYMNANFDNFDTRINTVSTNFVSLSSSFTRSLSSNGYQIIPGGLIMQWGESGSLGGDVNQTLTFPIPFPNVCLKAFVSIKNTSTTNDDIFARVISYNSTQITVRAEGTPAGVTSGTRSIDYLAIGF